MTASVLDGIPGLGETRRKALLRHFGSVKKIRAATAEELTEVSGIGPALAATIAAELATQGSGTPAVNLMTGEIIDEDGAGQ
jgi:excinuclease ABC subunit C